MRPLTITLPGTPATGAALVLVLLACLGLAGIAVAGPVVGPGTAFEASADGPTVTITEELELADGEVFPDDRTVDLSPHATFVSDGATNVTVDTISGAWTNVTTHDVAAGLEIDPSDKQTVTVRGSDVSTLNVSAVDTTTDAVDVTYDADSAVELTVTGLPAETTIDAVDADSDAQLDQQTTDGSGTATFSLDSGVRAITFREATDDFVVDITGTNSPVTEGETLTVDVTVENVGTVAGERTVELLNFDGVLVDDEPVSLDTGEGTDRTLTWDTASAGDGTITASVARSEDSAVVEIESESSQQPPDSGDDDSTDESADDEDPADERTVSVDERVDPETGDRTIQVTITDSDSGAVVTLDNTSMPTGGPIAALSNSTVENVTLSMARPRQQTSLNITGYEPDVTGREMDDPPGDANRTIAEIARAFEQTTGTVPAGYLVVEHGLADGDLDGVRIEFTVRKSRLADLDTGPGNVSLARTRNGTKWNTVPAAQTGENETHYRFVSHAPGFSVFVIDTGAEALSVADPTLNPETVDIGDSVTVTVSVSNRGTVPAERELVLTVGGSPADRQTVSVPGESDTTVEFAFEPEQAGEYELAVNDRSAGIVTVTDSGDDGAQTPGDAGESDDTDSSDGGTAGDDEATGDSTDDGSDDGTTGDDAADSDGSGRGFGVGGAIVSLLLLAVFASRRRDSED
jgi:hypothetical protein